MLVPVTAEHVPHLRRILRTPEVRLRWGDEAASQDWPFDDPSATRFAVLLDRAVGGLVQYGEEEDPAYRHASIDIFLDPAVHGRGIGRDAVGYRPVGVLRRYERDVDGTGWHDGLLMDLLAEELAQPR